jgi:Fur family ferric uptake transcriptional regulator
MEPDQAELKRVHRMIQSFGLHRTTPRVAVLRALMDSNSPLSHAEIAELLKGSGVGSATVYANLKAMASVGLLRRLDLGDHIWRYELAQASKGGKPNRERLHFLCNKCGRVSRLPGSTVDLHLAARAPRSAREGRFEVQVRGVCDDCVEDDIGNDKLV